MFEPNPSQDENEEGEATGARIVGYTTRSPYSTAVSLQRDVVIK
jgi:hypothetical protein